MRWRHVVMPTAARLAALVCSGTPAPITKDYAGRSCALAPRTQGADELERQQRDGEQAQA